MSGKPKWLRHLATINHHKKLVMGHLFRLGLYKQALLHDLSKYSPAEFIPGVRYYTGTRSPHDGERKDLGYSAAWLHHKGRNKHHMEYWLDYQTGSDEPITGMKMPTNYLIEMICDRIAACQNYHGADYADGDAWAYYDKNKSHYILHPETRAELERLLILLRDEGMEAAMDEMKRMLG